VEPLCPGPVSNEGCDRVADYSSTKILVYASNGATLIKTVNVDASGNYLIELPGGKYLLDYSSNYGLPSVHTKQNMTIETGKITTWDFTINTGIL
jgi:hypothetical protein